MMNCKHCGAEIGDHEKFCRYCGKAQQKTCPKCGAALSDTAKFCNRCGAAMSEPAKTPVKAPKAEKKRPWGLIAVIAVLCVALIGGGIFAAKTFTEFRDRQDELEQQLADRDKEEKPDKNNDKDKDDDRTETDPEPAPEPEPEPDPDAPTEVPAERPSVTPEQPPHPVEFALPYRPDMKRPDVDFDHFYVGLVLPGRTDSGQSAEIYEGLCSIMAELGLEDSRILTAEECATAEAAYNACHGLASSGCGMVFVAAALDPQWEILLAEEFPDTVFTVLGGTAAAISGLPNLVNAWPKTHEMWHIAGAVAGAQLQQDLIAGVAYAPFAAFFVEEYTTQAISDYSAFYLGMKIFCPDAVLFTFRHGNDPNLAREMAYEAAWGIGCSVLAEHTPDNSVLPEVVLEIEESGQACHFFSGNLDPLRMGYELDGFSMEFHWSWLLGKIIWAYVDGAPMMADYTIGMSDGLLLRYAGIGLCESAMEAVDRMTVMLHAGEPVFATDNFICYPDGTAGLKDGHVVDLPIWDTDFDGVADYGNAAQGGIIQEGHHRSAPVFNLQIEGIEVIH